MLVLEGVEAGGPGQSRTEQVCRAGHQGHGPRVPEEERGAPSMRGPPPLGLPLPLALLCLHCPLQREGQEQAA